jgi:UDP-N-acetylglucosamine:LPS N-acetylglucosamine transferase
MEERGAAVVIEPDEVTPDLLYEQLRKLFETPGLLEDMAKASAKAGVRNAAEKIVLEELERIGYSGRGEEEKRGKGETSPRPGD